MSQNEAFTGFEVSDEHECCPDPHHDGDFSGFEVGGDNENINGEKLNTKRNDTFLGFVDDQSVVHNKLYASISGAPIQKQILIPDHGEDPSEDANSHSSGAICGESNNDEIVPSSILVTHDYSEIHTDFATVTAQPTRQNDAKNTAANTDEMGNTASASSSKRVDSADRTPVPNVSSDVPSDASMPAPPNALDNSMNAEETVHVVDRFEPVHAALCSGCSTTSNVFITAGLSFLAFFGAFFLTLFVDVGFVLLDLLIGVSWIVGGAVVLSLGLVLDILDLVSNCMMGVCARVCDDYESAIELQVDIRTRHLWGHDYRTFGIGMIVVGLCQSTVSEEDSTQHEHYESFKQPTSSVCTSAFKLGMIPCDVFGSSCAAAFSSTRDDGESTPKLRLIQSIVCNSCVLMRSMFEDTYDSNVTFADRFSSATNGRWFQDLFESEPPSRVDALGDMLREMQRR